MILVAGTVQIKPEMQQKAAQVALKMVAETKKEPGCLTYDFWSDLADASRFHVFEEWETLAALEAHFQTPHMAEFQAALPELLAGPPDINRYEVTSAVRLM